MRQFLFWTFANRRISVLNSLGSISLAALVLLQAAAGGLAQGNSRFVGAIKDSSVRDACGCYFQSLAEARAGGQGIVFFSGSSETTAWVNVDGLDVRLKHVRSVGSRAARRGPHRRGRKTIDLYEGGGVKVRLERVVTKACPADEPTCEYVEMRATITVEEGGRRQVIRGVGGCGC